MKVRTFSFVVFDFMHGSNILSSLIYSSIPLSASITVFLLIKQYIVFTFASICLVSWFWNKNLILLLPSSEEPLSWENLYLQRTA